MSDGYHLVVFDWDGTLLDSIGAIVGCTRAVLDELGLPQVEESKIRGVIGLGLRETVEALNPGCDEDTFWQVVSSYRRLWLGHFCSTPVLFDGVEELLETLRERGLLLAVATAKGRGGLDHDLERTGLGSFFGTSRTVDEAPSKPDPQMLLDILEELSIAREAAVMVGDTVHDLTMAANAGVDAVGVVSGTQPRALLEKAKPVACLESVRELSDWLAQAGDNTVCTDLADGSG
ncbi:MAG: HAD-IA family hydrolase [Acidobacteriota bacterium]|nr:HAD-IA family hydrolase [Acidobacteriota bacterium]